MANSAHLKRSTLILFSIICSHISVKIISESELLSWERDLQCSSCCLPSVKGCTLKGKNLLTLGANSFLLGSKFFPFREDPFKGGDWCARKQTGSKKSLRRPRWLSWMPVRLETSRSRVQPLPRSATFFRGD